MRKKLEQVGPSDHSDRPPIAGDDDRIRAPGQRGEDLVERIAGIDRRQRRLHGVCHVLVQGVGVLEDPVEQVSVLERADDVGERL
jgi:hypothetical protein